MAGPLSKLKVLDFSTLLPGPYATMCLADLGADVLQIVSGSRPDLADIFPPFIPGTKLSANSAYLRRNKRSMALNLKDPRAVKIIHRLLADYDIVVEQFRPGVMTKMGFGYEDLKKVNPALIYCSLTGYGQTGPLRDRAGHDINYIARSGIASYSGKRDSGPALLGIQVADVASGSMNAIIGILAALAHRHVAGEGQHVDVSMTDGMMAFTAISGASFFVSGKDIKREGDMLNGGSLYDYYETKDGRHISFGGLEPRFFSAFCDVIGRPDLAAGGFLPQNIKQVKSEVRAIILSKTLAEWMDLFSETDACVEPVMTMSEVFGDSLALERGMVVEVPLASGGSMRQLANPIKFSATAPEYRRTGTGPGVHTAEVLRELGYTDSEIEEFDKTGLFK
jgi:crotonobetainyl-CoA:carnitine CoA-transferase CaiB-like acyl-CoA transferase